MASPINTAVIKKRPILTGTVILGGGLVFYFLFLRGGSKSSDNSGSLGYTDTQVAAASEMAQIQAQSAREAQQIQGQIAMAQIGASNQLAVAASQNEAQKAMAAMSLAATQAGYARDIEGVRAQERVQLAGLDSQERIAIKGYERDIFGMETSAEIQALTIQSQVVGLQSQLARDVAMQQMMTDAQVSLGTISGQVQMAGIKAQENIGHHTLDATTQQIKYQSELQLGIAQQQTKQEEIRANADMYGAAQSADATKYAAKKSSSASKTGAIVGVIGTIATVM